MTWVTLVDHSVGQLGEEMGRTRLHAPFAAALVFVFAAFGDPSGARAQSSPACARLESQLAALNGGGAAANAQRLRQMAAQQRAELDRTIAQAQSFNCNRGLFIFGPTPAPQCTELNRRVTKLRTDVDRLTAQAAQAQNGNEPLRRQLVASLAQNNCGPQYRSAANQPQRQRAGLLGLLFGGEASEDPSVSPVPEAAVPEAPVRSSTFRTVCVRSCDGFFFPISYTTSSASFPRDEAICRMTCPGTDAKLFAYPNPGGAIEQAVSAAGEPYTQMPNAFRYRTEYVSGCSCKPAGMSWAQALSGIDDQTLRKGDIVVDEARSQQLSQPKGSVVPAAAAPRSPPVQAMPPSPPAAQDAPRSYLEPPVDSEAPFPDGGGRLPGEMIITPDLGQ